MRSQAVQMAKQIANAFKAQLSQRFLDGVGLGAQDEHPLECPEHYATRLIDEQMALQDEHDRQWKEGAEKLRECLRNVLRKLKHVPFDSSAEVESEMRKDVIADLIRDIGYDDPVMAELKIMVVD
jgi:hypothetical protein